MLRTLTLALLFAGNLALAGPVTLESKGTVRDALKQLAAASGINLIVIGTLDEPMEIFIKDASGEDALSIVAQSAQLHVERKGSIWTVRKMTEAERKAAEAAAPLPVPPPSPPPVREAPRSPEQQLQALEQEAMALERKLQDVERLAQHMEDKDDQADVLEAARERARELDRRKSELAREQTDLQQKLLKRFGKKRASGNDAVRTGGKLVVAEGQSVDNAVAYGGPVEVFGSVGGDVVAFGGHVQLGPKAVVEGDVVAFGGDIQKDPGAVVGGQEISFGGRTTGVVIAKELAKAQEEAREVTDSSRPLSKVGSFFARFAVLFALGFLFTLFSPQRMKALEGEIRAAPARSLVTGVVGAIAMIPLTILLTVTVIGIPFVPALWILAGLGVSMGFAAVAAAVGMRMPILRGRKTQALVLAVGLLVLLLLGMVPVLGPTALVAVSLMAFGAIIRTRFGSSRRLGQPTPLSELGV